MAAKPSVDPKWTTSQDPADMIEPTPDLKTNGILSGGVWGREHLNWMFNTLSQWIDWVRSYALDKDNNLSDVVSKSAARTNLEVYSKEESDALDTTGNAATATKLETSRTIGGVDFDGSANIDLAGVNTEGSQDTTGNAATATKLETARTIDITGDITATAVSFDGSANIAISAAVNNDSHSHTASTLASATTGAKGVVEKATTAEMTAGTADKYPDAATVKTFFESSTPSRDPLTVWTGSSTTGVTDAMILADTGFTVTAGKYILTSSLYEYTVQVNNLGQVAMGTSRPDGATSTPQFSSESSLWHGILSKFIVERHSLGVTTPTGVNISKIEYIPN